MSSTMASMQMPKHADATPLRKAGSSLSSISTAEGYAECQKCTKVQATSAYYDLLIGPDTVSSQPSILFGWWPKSSNWSLNQLIERCTRCLPAVRPSLDMVALPDLTEVHELWDCWCEVHGLSLDQAIWFPPCLGENVVEDAALEICQKVLASAQVTQMPRGCLHFYPMYLTTASLSEAGKRGLAVIGDAEDHEIAPLDAAKAWLHPRISDDGEPCSSSLRDVLPPKSQGVRGPRGYVATSFKGLCAAWRRLHEESPEGTRFVLKPASGSGGAGVTIDANFDDLRAFDFSCSSAILEEMIVGEKPLRSPTLYMIGNSVCGRLADQVLLSDGVTNIGNRYPSTLRADFLTVCTAAAQKVNETWGLTSNWGLDFVIDTNQDPIIVDLNMGRPNGNFAVRLWSSIQRPGLSVFTGSWVIPASGGPTIRDIKDALMDARLLWNGHEGVIVYQHVPGFESSFAVASSFGDNAMNTILSQLSKMMRARFTIEVSAKA